MKKLELVNAREKTLSNEDFYNLAEIEEHPEVAKWDIPAFRGNTEKAFRAFKKSIAGLSKRDDEFLVAKVSGKTVGFVGLHRLKGEIGEMKHIGEVGIAVHPHFQREGIGTRLLESAVELARKRSFRRLEADTRANNVAMRRILEKTGFYTGRC